MKKFDLPIALGSDHAGFELKEKIKIFLNENNISFFDYGCFSTESVDYPDFAHQVAFSIEKNESHFGIILCGSGNGINITANKHQKIRSALCWNSEIASLARLHNDANVCALPARFISIPEGLKIVETFLSTEFEGGRHSRRVEKIPVKNEHQ